MHNIDDFIECYGKLASRPIPVDCSAIVSATDNQKAIKIKYLTLARTDDKQIHQSYLFNVEGRCV